jgi:hypothetical protein
MTFEPNFKLLGVTSGRFKTTILNDDVILIDGNHRSEAMGSSGSVGPTGPRDEDPTGRGRVRAPRQIAVDADERRRAKAKAARQARKKNRR